MGRIRPSIFCMACSKCLSPGLHGARSHTWLSPPGTCQNPAATCPVLGLSCEAQVGTELKAGVGAGRVGNGISDLDSGARCWRVFQLWVPGVGVLCQGSVALVKPIFLPGRDLSPLGGFQNQVRLQEGHKSFLSPPPWFITFLLPDIMPALVQPL